MATLVLQTAGALIGNALGIPGGEMIGGAGSHSNGPRLASMGTLTSNEGAPIPRVYGRVRLGGEMIWATRFEEVIGKRRSSGGKGIGGGVSTKTYSYFANFAIGLCEGEIAFVRRIWADGKEMDLSTLTMRVYRGDEAQEADPLIIAKEGATNAPAYRGLAYIVFERFPLVDFGNRIPQMNFEIVRPVQGVAQKIRGVDLIPGASEFAYTPSFRSQGTSLGITRPENRHQLYAPSDWTGSIDALQALCPNLNSVALVVAWFGDDLRCGSCTIAPRVESQVKITSSAWAVDGLWRSTARLVSQIDGKPAYGGTPSDSCVIDAIQDLKARGLSVVFYPFVMMDVAEGNTLTDPWTGANTQPAFPWRGRITCHPAPGQGGTVDASAAAATQVASFFGTSNPLANEWSYRRFILHYANLCHQAGGVSAFLMGSELAALTRVRSSVSAYPAVAALTTLAGNVKAILGAGTKISYAADWTEYGAHVLPNGDVRFPLDSLWSSSAVDFIGLDAYWPLSDWRDGTTHLDAQLARNIYDKPYLQSRMKAGEAYDFYYADDAARLAQTRTPITDGAYNKPWIYRAKDIKNWWLNAHYERVAGVENTSPTSWVPQSKPIWLIEIGCPAIDRGANAPNVFPDAKSSQSALPPFSRGYRDDLMQVRALDAILTHFDADLPGHISGDNPVSAVYGGRMVDAARTHIWAWDARPFPAFPDLSSVWSDAQNWQTGHWLNGRIEGMCVENLVDAVLDDCPAMQATRQSTPIDGYVDGYVLDRQLSARGSLEPLAALFGFDAVLSGGQLRFAPRALSANITLNADDLVPDKDGRLVTRTRQQESELPHEISLTFIDGDSDYREASVLSRRIEGFSKRETSAQMALITNRAEMKRLADITLQDVWAGRERAQFTVRPGLMALEIGDCVRLNVEGVKGLFRIEQISDGEARSISARAVEPTVFDRAPPRFERNVKSAPLTPGPARIEILDLALARIDPTPLQYMAAFADPWAGSLAVYRASTLGSYELVTTLTTPAIIGETLNDFHAGPVSHWDRANVLHVRVGGGELSSVSEVEALAGRTAMAIKGTDGAWEIFAFATAELVGEKTYSLSKLIRGMGGEEHLSQRMVPTGATVVLLDSALLPLSEGVDDLGASLTYRVGPANRDHGDPSYVQISTAPTTKALKPYAPVKVVAKREASGVMISFVRRGRRDADGWESPDIPLGETSENYRVEIWSGATLRRALTTSTSNVLYSSLAELFDFGAAQTSLHLKISQTSAAVGQGFIADVTVSVH